MGGKSFHKSFKRNTPSVNYDAIQSCYENGFGNGGEGGPGTDSTGVETAGRSDYDAELLGSSDGQRLRPPPSRVESKASNESVVVGSSIAVRAALATSDSNASGLPSASGVG